MIQNRVRIEQENQGAKMKVNAAGIWKICILAKNAVEVKVKHS